MAFNINEFSSQVNKRGLAVSNLHVMRMTVPPFLEGRTSQDITMSDLQFFCSSIQLPSLETQTYDYLPQGFGSPSRRPTGMQFPLLPTVFMVDAEFAITRFFHSWMQNVINYDNEQPFGEVNGALPFELGYPEEYISTLDVVQYGYNSEQSTYTHSFSGAFPVSIGGVQTAWENGAEVMTLPVTFSYDRLKVDGALTGRVNESRRRGRGTTANVGSARGLPSFSNPLAAFQADLNNWQKQVDWFKNLF